MKRASLHMHHKQNGMTLIEVLVASTILFSVLALMSQVMGGALKGSEQAQKNIEISYGMPFILDGIKSKMAEGALSENGMNFSQDLSYNWHASVIKELPIYQFVGQGTPSKRKVKLYEVVLNIKFKQLEKNFNYMELQSEK